MNWRELWADRSGVPPSHNAEPDTTIHPCDNAQPARPLYGLRPGMRVCWNSPLFGEVHGIVDALPTNGWVMVKEHSVTNDVCTIPLDWVTKVGE